MELLKGAGLSDIVIPRKDFIKEHQHLIQLLRKSDDSALRKEASSQEKELKKEVKGGKKMSAQSGFIRRMMAENNIKHQGQYRNPTWRLHPDSQMKAPWKFEYQKLANQEQSDRGENEEAYGASPFIQKHFGHAQAVPFVRKRGQPYPTEPFKRGQKPQYMEPPAPSAPSLPSVPPESEEQKEARQEFEEEAPKTERIRLTAENAPDFIGKKVYYKSGGEELSATITKASPSGIMIDEGPANLKNNLTFKRVMTVDAEAPKASPSSSSSSSSSSTPMGPVIAEEKQEARGPVVEEEQEAPEPRQTKSSEASSAGPMKKTVFTNEMRRERLDKLEREIRERAEVRKREHDEKLRQRQEEKDKALLERLRAKKQLSDERKEAKNAYKEWKKEWNDAVRRMNAIKEGLDAEPTKEKKKALKAEKAELKQRIEDLKIRKPAEVAEE